MKTELKEKHCNDCNTTKPVEEFYVDKWNSTGYTGACMACMRERSRKYGKSERGKKTAIIKTHRFQYGNPEKHRARVKARAAAKSGKIVKPENCDRCNQPCHPQAHHHDYSKPLEVDWLCDPCHKFIHGKLKDLSLLSPAQTIIGSV